MYHQSIGYSFGILFQNKFTYSMDERFELDGGFMGKQM